jgi:hypothetical protein
MKKLISFILVSAVSVCWFSFAQAQSAKKMNKNGTVNIIFASANIPKGKESTVALKTKFSDSDAIWARAYFPQAFGTLEGEAEGFIDMWVDGKHIKRLAFSNRDVAPDKDQMLIYIHNTGNDDFKEEVWNEISAGEHKIKIVVGKTQFLKKKVTLDIEDDNLVAKGDDVYKAVYLSESDITFIKK